ncbi:MAG: RES domain-containing protein [Pseudomonadota bacterium]
MIAYRVATETRKYGALDLSGLGAAVDPGRWNKPGQAVLYTALSAALAMLETVAHIDAAGLPLNKFMIEITIPDEVWARREVLDLARLDPTWKAVPAGLAGERAGSEWIDTRRSALLLVPSVIVPEESCLLVNPAHADAQTLSARVLRKVEYDSVFRSGGR